ncbi:MAG: hypothetical protein ACR2IF_07815 [Terriglobales bacterium]
MLRAARPIAFALLLFAGALCAATPGIFRGIILIGPDHDSGWIMVKGANGQVRRVAIASAVVVYAETVPVSDRQKTPVQSIVHGAEVRVTAEQDGNGEWRASRIEILKLKAEMPLEPSQRSESVHST